MQSVVVQRVMPQVIYVIKLVNVLVKIGLQEGLVKNAPLNTLEILAVLVLLSIMSMKDYVSVSKQPFQVYYYF